MFAMKPPSSDLQSVGGCANEHQKLIETEEGRLPVSETTMTTSMTKPSNGANSRTLSGKIRTTTTTTPPEYIQKSYQSSATMPQSSRTSTTMDGASVDINGNEGHVPQYRRQYQDRPGSNVARTILSIFAITMAVLWCAKLPELRGGGGGSGGGVSSLSSSLNDSSNPTHTTTTTTTSSSSSASFLLGSTGLVPPYVAKGIPSSPSLHVAKTIDIDPAPFSLLSPKQLGIETHDRSPNSKPGAVFGSLRYEEEQEQEKYNEDDSWTPSRSSIPVDFLGESSQSKEEMMEHDNNNNNNYSWNAMPTNAWYQNLLIGSVSEGRLTANNRAYTVPYILDFVGPIPGVRIQFPRVLTGDTIVQLSSVDRHGLTLGSKNSENGDDGNDDVTVDTAYVVDEDSPPRQLGLGLKWMTKRRSDGDNNNNNNNGSSSHHSYHNTDTTKTEANKDSHPTMKMQVIRGMPYVTMEYSAGMKTVVASQLPLGRPPIIDGKTLSQEAFVCGELKEEENEDTHTTTNNAIAYYYDVKKEVSLTFKESDMSWLVFFSRPVRITFFCKKNDENAKPLPPGVVDFSTNSEVELHVVDDDDDDDKKQPLIVRAALENSCTFGGNSLFCVGGQPQNEDMHLGDLLRAHADIYPHNPFIQYQFPSPSTTTTTTTTTATPEDDDEESGYASIIFNWGARSMSGPSTGASEVGESLELEQSQQEDLLMYALPHHIDSIERVVANGGSETGYCANGLHGAACLLRGDKWVMREDLDGPPSFVALRPPHHDIVPALAQAVSSDIHYALPEYYMAGAGDTYFSGKMLAKLGRIIVIALELRGLAATPDLDKYNPDDPSEHELLQIVAACQEVALPSDDTIAAAISRLRSGVEIWLNGTAQAKFVYDGDWGGFINCGCLFNSKTQRCDNEYPNCPAFGDPGLNFGNGFYNDHHFHYGYMIYAAAVVANYDYAWGRKHFEEVLLLIRDIANPSIHDKFFPAFRQKDWFLGSSWASGIATLGGQPYLNGRNQESSSEAINSYEAISLYGSVMIHAWNDDEGRTDGNFENEKVETATRISEMGRLLTATEVRSAARYWHVLHGDDAINTIYPKQYKPAVVGMMWQTMCQFQTWFGSAAFLAYGIQLMPLTSVSEKRDSLKWLQQLYFPFAESCESDQMCKDQGWAVLQYSVLAAVGHRNLAADKAVALAPSVFESAGGNGHSLTNTLWYIATRPDVEEPLRLEHLTNHGNDNKQEQSIGVTNNNDNNNEPPPGRRPIPDSTDDHAAKEQLTSCGCEETCTEDQLNVNAGGYTCRARIEWLMSAFGKSELSACRQVGGNEFTTECASCDPDRCVPPPPPKVKSPEELSIDKVCAPCSPSVCQNNEINRCPRSLLAPFICLSGGNKGGCSQTAWTVACTECCRLTEDCFAITGS